MQLAVQLVDPVIDGLTLLDQGSQLSHSGLEARLPQFPLVALSEVVLVGHLGIDDERVMPNYNFGPSCQQEKKLWKASAIGLVGGLISV